MNQLGPTIANLRRKRKMSLQKLATEAGLTKAHVWELEQGRASNPNLATLIGLGRALGVTAARLTEAATREDDTAAG